LHGDYRGLLSGQRALDIDQQINRNRVRDRLNDVGGIAGVSGRRGEVDLLHVVPAAVVGDVIADRAGAVSIAIGDQSRGVATAVIGLQVGVFGEVGDE